MRAYSAMLFVLLQSVLLQGLVAAQSTKLSSQPAAVSPETTLCPRGAEFLREEKYADAEREYRAALQSDPQNDNLHTRLAQALNGRNKPDEAEAQAYEALRLNPRNVMAHVSLGVALSLKGDNDDAIAEFREALRMNPANEDAHVNLGNALGEKGDFDGEIAESRAVLLVNPRNVMAHIALGSALSNKDDVDGAIGELREALRLNPRSTTAHLALGSQLYRKSDLNGAITELHEAVRLDPKLAVAHYVLALSLYGKGDQQAALQESHTAYTLDPQNAAYKENYEKLTHAAPQPKQAAGVSVHPYDLVQNPFAHRNKLVRLMVSPWPILVNGRVVQWSNVARPDLGWSGLRFERMLKENEGLYDVMGQNYESMGGLEVLWQIAVLTPNASGAELNIGLNWLVKPLGTLSGTNYLGAPIQVPLVQSLRNADE